MTAAEDTVVTSYAREFIHAAAQGPGTVVKLPMAHLGECTVEEIADSLLEAPGADVLRKQLFGVVMMASARQCPPEVLLVAAQRALAAFSEAYAQTVHECVQERKQGFQ